jgi:hypothetical protein
MEWFVSMEWCVYKILKQLNFEVILNTKTYGLNFWLDSAICAIAQRVI